jgi:hypothetical protein
MLTSNPLTGVNKLGSGFLFRHQPVFCSIPAVYMREWYGGDPMEKNTEKHREDDNGEHIFVPLFPDASDDYEKIKDGSNSPWTKPSDETDRGPVQFGAYETERNGYHPDDGET